MANMTSTQKDRCDSQSAQKETIFMKVYNDEANFQINPINVTIRLMFRRIGEIDTLNEKYQAQASIESRWPIELDKLLPNLSSDEQNRLIHGKSVSLINYAESQWHPQLYIENALGDLKEQIRYSAKKSKIDSQIYICEHRDIKGLFWEKLELHHFPSDVQDLSISIASILYNDKVLLIADPFNLSGVNREAFVDQQEWSLYEHVDTQERYVREYLFQSKEEEETKLNINDERQRSFLTISCHAARRSGYFYWNGYCLVFLITICAFCTFSIPPNLPQNRLQITVTLLLTSVTFRWTVNRSLPTISYLTTLDKYAIVSIFILIILSTWHALIAFIIFIDINQLPIDTNNFYVWIDRYLFLIFFGLYICMHLCMFIWLYRIPYGYRREMKKKDIEYQHRFKLQTMLIKQSSPPPLTYLHDEFEKTNNQNRSALQNDEGNNWKKDRMVYL